MNNIQIIRNILKENSSSMMSITFNKKCGAVRKLQTNPKCKKGTVTSYKTESTKQAVATRKRNNPNMLSVIDMQVKRKTKNDSASWRSVNLETVKEIKSRGKVYRAGVDF